MGAVEGPPISRVFARSCGCDLMASKFDGGRRCRALSLLTKHRRVDIECLLPAIAPAIAIQAAPPGNPRILEVLRLRPCFPAPLRMTKLGNGAGAGCDTLLKVHATLPLRRGTRRAPLLKKLRHAVVQVGVEGRGHFL